MPYSLDLVGLALSRYFTALESYLSSEYHHSRE